MDGIADRKSGDQDGMVLWVLGDEKHAIDPNTRITHCFIVQQERGDTWWDQSIGQILTTAGSQRSSIIGGGCHMVVCCLLEEPIGGEYPFLIVENSGKKFIWLAKSWNDGWGRCYGFDFSETNYDTSYPPSNSDVSGMKYRDVVNIYKKLAPNGYCLTTYNCDDMSQDFMNKAKRYN